MRRNVGLSSLPQQSPALASYSLLSTSLSEQQLGTLQSQLATFQAALRAFASKHRAKILSDPVFRTHFSDMCNQLGVDPLGNGGRKGVWDFLGVGEWTYALAIQVVDVCLQTRETNGGLMEMDEVVRGVTRLRRGSEISSHANAPNSSTSSHSHSITASDVSRAINSLEPLGCGYSIIDVGNKKMVRSVAAEFDTDSFAVLECASEGGQGYVSVATLRSWTAGTRVNAPSSFTEWTMRRAENAFSKALLEDGLVWLDDGGEGEIMYWVPALFDFQEYG
ncbi:MAG: hypothetical protein CYPHOPRED_001085 [Cyphobasidiales sp. Tagirdzhanova-0007]|nr:MAG: hypothetical protein CYPHOPRED_001085 [Cyphobasidiales sp. Tagirdzhanova-0007]